MHERSGNVYENKGQGQKVEEFGRTDPLCLGRVIILLDNWRNKARMYMKTKEDDKQSGVGADPGHQGSAPYVDSNIGGTKPECI
jgi:hypothetical protein